MHHRRHQRARQKIGGQHRQHHCQRHRSEEKLHCAFEKYHWDENNADGERRHEGRHGDLLRAIENRFGNRFAHGEIAMDIFDLHRRVID